MPCREPSVDGWNWCVCTIDDWRRTYRFGINRPSKMFPGPYDEWDMIEVSGTLRHQDHEGV